jgi:hypothetical protein
MADQPRGLQFKGFFIADDWAVRVGVERYGRIARSEVPVKQFVSRLFWGVLISREARGLFVIEKNPYAFDARGLARQDLVMHHTFLKLNRLEDHPLPPELCNDIQAIRWNRMRLSPPGDQTLLSRIPYGTPLLRSGS